MGHVVETRGVWPRERVVKHIELLQPALRRTDPDRVGSVKRVEQQLWELWSQRPTVMSGLHRQFELCRS